MEREYFNTLASSFRSFSFQVFLFTDIDVNLAKDYLKFSWQIYL